MESCENASDTSGFRSINNSKTASFAILVNRNHANWFMRFIEWAVKKLASLFEPLCICYVDIMVTWVHAVTVQQAEAKNQALLELPRQFPCLKEAAQWVGVSGHNIAVSSAADWSVLRPCVWYVWPAWGRHAIRPPSLNRRDKNGHIVKVSN